MNDENAQTIVRSDGVGLSARHRSGQLPTLIFLPGLRSDMTGDKATALAEFGRTRGYATLLLDYSGHGSSGGSFTEGSVAVWRDDALAVIDALAPGPVVIVGSSMGGWIGLMVARVLGTRVRGFVGVAAAPDFTRRIEASLSASDLTTLARDGVVMTPALPDPLPITRRVLRDGEACCLLDRPIELACPVRLLHGQKDNVVPWRTAMEIADRVTGVDCQVVLVKDGDHRLSRPSDIALLKSTVGELLQTGDDRRAQPMYGVDRRTSGVDRRSRPVSLLHANEL